VIVIQTTKNTKITKFSFFVNFVTFVVKVVQKAIDAKVAPAVNAILEKYDIQALIEKELMKSAPPYSAAP